MSAFTAIWWYYKNSLASIDNFPVIRTVRRKSFLVLFCASLVWIGQISSVTRQHGKSPKKRTFPHWLSLALWVLDKCAFISVLSHAALFWFFVFFSSLFFNLQVPKLNYTACCCIDWCWDLLPQCAFIIRRAPVKLNDSQIHVGILPE